MLPSLIILAGMNGFTEYLQIGSIRMRGLAKYIERYGWIYLQY